MICFSDMLQNKLEMCLKKYKCRLVYKYFFSGHHYCFLHFSFLRQNYPYCLQYSTLSAHNVALQYIGEADCQNERRTYHRQLWYTSCTSVHLVYPAHAIIHSVPSLCYQGKHNVSVCTTLFFVHNTRLSVTPLHFLASRAFRSDYHLSAYCSCYTHSTSRSNLYFSLQGNIYTLLH